MDRADQVLRSLPNIAAIAATETGGNGDLVRPEWLLPLPPTEDLESAVKRAHRRDHTYWTAASGTRYRTTSTLHPEEVARRIRVAERELRWGRIRDTVQANRPEGCWCFGVGYYPVRIHPLDPLPAQRDGYPLYCPCPDGQRVEREHRGAWASDAARTERERKAWLWDLVTVPPKYADCTLDSYDALIERYRMGTRLQRMMAELRRWLVNEGKPSLFLWGEVGTGKTGLAFSLLRELVLGRGLRGFWATWPELVSELRNAMAPSGPESARQTLGVAKTVPVLMVDDLGAEKPSEWTDEQAFIVLNRRQNHGLRTIVTSNLDVKSLTAHLGRGGDQMNQAAAEQIGKRIGWRLVDSALVVHVDAPNIRALQAGEAA